MFSRLGLRAILPSNGLRRDDGPHSPVRVLPSLVALALRLVRVLAWVDRRYLRVPTDTSFARF